MYWSGIDADIADYACQCTICTKHKASLPAQPIPPRDIPDGPWQDIAVDNMTHKSQEYLIICNALSKYPFIYKASSKSARSLCMHLLKLISQYGPPTSISAHNGLPFASDELAEFLTCHYIEHHTSSPHFPRSNDFTERQVRTIKTALNTALPANKSLKTVLLDLQSTPIGPNMPSSHEILHNRIIQHSGRLSQPVDMEKIRNFLISRKQAQFDQFNKSHEAQALPELPPGQEVLFRSPADDEYIPRTIKEKATAPCSYIIEAQGKRYHRTREQVPPIHFNLPPSAHQQQNPQTKQCISGPSLPKSHIPRPNHSIPSLLRPSILPRPLTSCPVSQLPLCILHLVHTNKADTACPSVEDLHLHLSTITPLSSANVQPEKPQTPSAPCLALTLPAEPKEELQVESQAPWTARQVLPHTHCAPGCLSHIMRQP